MYLLIRMRRKKREKNLALMYSFHTHKEKR